MKKSRIMDTHNIKFLYSCYSKVISKSSSTVDSKPEPEITPKNKLTAKHKGKHNRSINPNYQMSHLVLICLVFGNLIIATS